MVQSAPLYHSTCETQEGRAKDATETKEIPFLANKTFARFASFARLCIAPILQHSITPQNPRTRH